MIAAIQGTILKKEPTHILVMTDGGVGYEIAISLSTYNTLTTERVFLYTAHLVREDAQTLYGFASESEKRMFLALLKVGGIGGKVAMAICSSFTPEQFAQIIASQNISLLKKVPGVGPKVAGRIMVELAGFAPSQPTTSSQALIETAQALEALGFKSDEVAKVLRGADPTLSTTELLRFALKQLQKF